MIDWLSLAFSALWILGLALVLATLSFANYQARQAGIRLRQALSTPSFSLPISLGLLLFCLGMSYGTQPLWQRLLWLLLAAAFAYDAFSSWRRS
ncbi:MAG: hypothetical protein ACUVWR_17495 [Anaerolineae bacterium]